MTVFWHEIKRGKTAFLIWTGMIAFLILICMVLYPEMKTQMESVSEMFANMGSFTAAFGMDQVNFGEVMGFYAVEGGNIMGLGGAFFAALLGTAALSKEEKEHTAEFLFVRPVGRIWICIQKWLAAAAEILAMNLAVMAVSAVCFWVIGEEMDGKAFILLHGAFIVMQLEILGVCFGISAFLKGGAMGAGLGLAAVLYFLNIIRNISEQAEWLKYVTPFAYGEASDIVSKVSLDWPLIALGVLYGALGILAALLHYKKKDLSA